MFKNRIMQIVMGSLLATAPVAGAGVRRREGEGRGQARAQGQGREGRDGQDRQEGKQEGRARRRAAEGTEVGHVRGRTCTKRGGAELPSGAGATPRCFNMANDPEKLKQKLFDFARDFPFFNLIGFELVDFGPGWSKTRIALRPDLCNPNGVMHGGVIATLDRRRHHAGDADDRRVPAGARHEGHMTSVDLRVRYLRPLSLGLRRVRGEHPAPRQAHRPRQRRGTNDEGKEIALGDSMIMVTLGG